MADKTTNQKKGIVTRGSGHIAESSGVSLPYFAKPLTGTVMDDNHIETSKCGVPQAAQRTFIAGHNVLHHQSKIGFPFTGGPSRYDRPHSTAQKNPVAFQWFAEPTENSPDTKVEGKWIIRTFDKTLQDGHNGPGKLSPGPGSTEILDESELLFQQCAVEKIKLENIYSDDDGKSASRVTMEKELHVLLGDTVKVTAYRVNASETDPEKRLDVVCYITRLKQKKNPPAEETRHAAFVLTRNGRTVPGGNSWSEIKNKTLVGDNGSEAVAGSKKMAKISVLELKDDWLLTKDERNWSVAGVGGDYESHDRRMDGKDVSNNPMGPVRERQTLQNRVSSSNSRVATARAQSGRNNAKPGAISRAENNRRDARSQLERYDRNAPAREAERSANADAAKSLQSNARLAFDSYYILLEYFFYKPLRIDIEAHGCSPGASAVIQGYPPEKYGAELLSLKDFPGRQTFDTLKSLITKISDFFQKIKGAKVREIGRQLSRDFGGDPRQGFNIDLYFLRHKKSTGTGKVTKDEDMSPSIELELQWARLTRDSIPAKQEIAGRKAWQVHRSWGVDVKLERLLGLVIQFDVDLNYCLGIGKVITDILKFLGVKTGVFLNVNVGLSVGIGGTIKRNEYGKWDLAIVNVPIKAVIQLSIEARVGRFFELAIRVTGRWEPKIQLGKNDKDQICLLCTDSTFDIVFTAEAKVDILGWDFDASYEIYKIPFKLEKKTLVVFGDGK